MNSQSKKRLLPSPPSPHNERGVRFLTGHELKEWYAAIDAAVYRGSRTRRATFESWRLESERSALCAKHR
jgi:hypothetical protein